MDTLIKMNKTIYAGWWFLLSLTPCLAAGEDEANTLTAQSELSQFQEEARQLRERYNNDLPKLTDQLRALNARRAKQLGLSDDLRSRERLQQKYGPVSESVEVDSPTSKFGKTIDMKAWSAIAEDFEGKLVIRFHLDRRRYEDATPKSLSIQLRRTGESAEIEHLLSLGVEIPNMFRVPLSFQQADGGIYSVSFNVSPADKKTLVIQIIAEIEPGWATSSNFPLNSLDSTP